MFRDLDLFKPTSWREAGIKRTNENNDGLATGHSVIKIIPNYYFWNQNRNDLKPVVGVTQNQVTVGIESSWQKMGVPKLPLIGSFGDFLGSKEVTDLSSLAGAGNIGSVWMSKQLWRENGYLKISPEFRIVDWEGNGKPLTSALLLAKMALPGESDSATASKIKELENKTRQSLNEVREKWTSDTNESAQNDKKRPTPSNMSIMYQDLLKGGLNRGFTIANSVLEDIHDLITLKKAPPPVRVQIGQYFYHPDMIIKNANFKFSKEVSDLGPLYVDVTLDLETRKIMSGIKDVGFVEVDKLQSRVRVEDINVQQPGNGFDINAGNGASQGIA